MDPHPGGDPEVETEIKDMHRKKENTVMAAPTGSLKRHGMFLCPRDLKRKHFLIKR